MAILDLGRDAWHDALSIPRGEEPDALILEGTWWRRQAEADRLGMLSGVVETGFPEIYLGRFGEARVAYCCAYGAPRAVEPAHVFAQMGTPLLVQIGTCGAIDPDLSAGMVMVPDQAGCRDGVSRHYGAGRRVDLDARWSLRARTLLAGRDAIAVGGLHLTWPSLFAQSDAMCRAWREEGFRSVDMETAAVAAVAGRFGTSAVALLSVWDKLPEGKTFLDPLDEPSQAALHASNRTVFEVALALAEEVSGQRKA